MNPKIETTNLRTPFNLEEASRWKIEGPDQSVLHQQAQLRRRLTKITGKLSAKRELRTKLGKLILESQSPPNITRKPSSTTTRLPINQ